jgi:hypothetical protein
VKAARDSAFLDLANEVTCDEPCCSGAVNPSPECGVRLFVAEQNRTTGNQVNGSIANKLLPLGNQLANLGTESAWVCACLARPPNAT